LNKHLAQCVTLLVLLVALLALITGCNATGAETSATVYGPGTDKMTDAAKSADEAVAAIARSTEIKVPAPIEAGKILIGSDSAYPPLEFMAKVLTKVDGKDAQSIQLVGFEIDLCKAMAKKLGLDPTFMTVDFTDVPSALSEGKVDIVASAMVTSPDLVAKFGASDVYLTADLAICTIAGTQLPDEAALAGKTVGVQSGSTAESVVKAVTGVGETRAYPQILGALVDLAKGKIDAVVIEAPAAEWLLANHADYGTTLKVSGTIVTGEGYGLWCKKDNQELLAAINAALQELRRVPAATPEITTTISAVTSTVAGETTSTTVAVTGPTVGVTSTTASGSQTAKSVYQLLCEKWGLTGN
jgi:polar amino acid transport system substrate-binding protein